MAGETLKEANRGKGPEITAHTVDCFWDGERMDCDPAFSPQRTYDGDPIDKQ